VRRLLAKAGLVVTVLLAAACNSGDERPASPTTVTSPTASPSPTSTRAPTVKLQPGDDIQALVEAQPAGTHYILAPGIYREQTITPQTGDTFEGEPGATLSGARLLEGFESSDGLWSMGGQTQFIDAHGGCSTPEALPDIEGYKGCRFSEQLFIDDEPLWQVTAIEQLAPGRWYFDYAANRIYLADDPAGHLVETSVSSAAFEGRAADVTVRGLVIEKYASPAQRGAIEGGGTRDWLVTDNEIRLNHGFGLRVGTGMQVRDNHVHHNGQVGLGGVGDGVVVEGNEVAYNHTAGFNEEWEAGGMKFAISSDLVISDNWVHHNAGRGIWTDIDIFDALIVGNLAEWNTRAGIVHEISFAAQILDNTARYNGLGFDNWVWGAQILVQNSSDVIVARNTVTVSEAGGNGIAIVNQERGAGEFGPYLSDRVSITDNVITHLGIAGANGAPNGCATTDSTFDENRYEAPVEWFEATNFEWCGVFTWEEFQLAGQELAGTRIDVS
jgi:hypothetical protein